MSQHRRIIELTATRGGGVVGPSSGSTVVEESNIMLMQPQIPTPPAVVDSEEILQAKSTNQISTNEQTAIYLAAGAAAGIMEHCVMFPIDSVKVSFLNVEENSLRSGFRPPTSSRLDVEFYIILFDDSILLSSVWSRSSCSTKLCVILDGRVFYKFGLFWLLGGGGLSCKHGSWCW